MLLSLQREESWSRILSGYSTPLLNTLNQTYTQPAEDVPRLLLGHPQVALALVYGERNKAGKSIESAGKVLTSLGFVFVGADSSHTRFAIIK